MIREHLNASNYVIEEKRRSRIDPEATLYVDVGLRCPFCKRVGDLIEHGHTRECACGLVMTVHGNCLTCEIDALPQPACVLVKGTP